MSIALHKEIITQPLFENLVTHAKAVYWRHRQYNKLAIASMSIFVLSFLGSCVFAMMHPDFITPVHHLLQGRVHLSVQSHNSVRSFVNLAHTIGEITPFAAVFALLAGIALSITSGNAAPLAMAAAASALMWFFPSILGQTFNTPSSTHSTPPISVPLYAPQLLSANRLAILSQRPKTTLDLHQRQTFAQDIRWLASHQDSWYIHHHSPYPAVTNPLRYLASLEMTPGSPVIPAVTHYRETLQSAITAHALSARRYFSLSALFLIPGIFFLALSLRLRSTVFKLLGSVEKEEADLLRSALNLPKQDAMNTPDPQDEPAAELILTDKPS